MIADESCYTAWWSKRLSGKRVNQLGPDLLEQSKSVLTKKGYAPQTILHYKKFLRHVLYTTVGKSAIPENRFEKVKLNAIRVGRTCFLSLKEDALLHDAIGPSFAPWVRLAILIGMRGSEQFRRRWTDVDLEPGFLTLGETKSGGVHHIPLTEEGIAILRALDSWQRSKWGLSQSKPIDTCERRSFLRTTLSARCGTSWS